MNIFRRGKLYDDLSDQFEKFQVAQDNLWKRVRQ